MPVVPERDLPKNNEARFTSFFEVINSKTLLEEAALTFRRLSDSLWFNSPCEDEWTIGEDRRRGFRTLLTVRFQNLDLDPKFPAAKLGYLVERVANGLNVDIALQIPGWKTTESSPEAGVIMVTEILNRELKTADFIKPDNVKMVELTRDNKYVNLLYYVIFPNASFFSRFFQNLSLNF